MKPLLNLYYRTKSKCSHNIFCQTGHCLSVCLSVFLSVCVCVCVCMCLSVCLCVYDCVCVHSASLSFVTTCFNSWILPTVHQTYTSPSLLKVIQSCVSTLNLKYKTYAYLDDNVVLFCMYLQHNDWPAFRFAVHLSCPVCEVCVNVEELATIQLSYSVPCF